MVNDIQNFVNNPAGYKHGEVIYTGYMYGRVLFHLGMEQGAFTMVDIHNALCESDSWICTFWDQDDVRASKWQYTKTA